MYITYVHPVYYVIGFSWWNTNRVYAYCLENAWDNEEKANKRTYPRTHPICKSYAEYFLD